MAVSSKPERCRKMNRWNDEPRTKPLESWVERTCAYLRSRTADHWLMFAGGLVLGAILG